MEQTCQPQHLFDQVLWSLETGRIEQATFTLSGALDGVIAAGGDIALWRKRFCSHPLSKLLGAGGPATSHPARHMREALAKLGFRRSLETRCWLAGGVIKDAWQADRRIFLADRATRQIAAELDMPAGDGPDVLTGNLGRIRKHSLDLIVAADRISMLPTSAAAVEFMRWRRALAPGGAAAFASFLPWHAGLGWQRICEGRRLYCHDEAALATAARAAGFDAHFFHDESDCLLWGVLRVADLGQSGGQNNA